MTSTTEVKKWTRDGLIWKRSASGSGSEVVGDPCIVWDADAEAWRMFLFYAPPGHASSLSRAENPGPGDWGPAEHLAFTNPDELPGGTHKPFVVMDAHRPNQAARVDGKYWLVTVSFNGDSRQKRVQRASAETLAGPWTLEAGDLIPRGTGADFDANHVDAVTGYWFEDEQLFVYYYMGYPLQPQPYAWSPLGSATGVATQKLGDARAKKLGVMLAPSSVEGHWASGWVGGFQILPGTAHKWVAILNASPTAPDNEGSLTSEEPAPSLGGFAYSDLDVPIGGWTFEPQPIEWVDEIPQEALAAGEGTNLWRQHILVTGDTVSLYYNSGFYGQEQLYKKSADKRDVGIR